MENLVNYLQAHKRYVLKYIEQNYLTAEIQSVLLKYNFTLYELCYRLAHNIPLDKVFKCKVCNKKINIEYKHGYRDFCSYSCSSKHTNNKLEIQDKKRQTCLERYGVDNHSKTKEFKDFLKDSRDVLEEKKRQTFLKKYGKEHYFQTTVFKDFLKKHQDDIQEKIKQTCIDKYGVDSYSKTQEYKDKYKRTCLDKYGTDSYFKSELYRTQLLDIQKKVYNTKKKNNSFCASKDENKVYNILLNKFGKEDVERQYKSEVYPFACDFYIKSLDLYIEYNGYFTHGWDKHKLYGSFNKEDPEHIKLLNKWKKKVNEVNFKGKEKEFYRNAIYTWTDLDVRKLECFKKNKLNYKIFWDVKEVEVWIQNLDVKEEE